MRIQDIKEIPSMIEILKIRKEANNLTDIDARNSKQSNMVRILQIDDNSIVQRLIRNYKLKKDRTYRLNDICCLDINSISLIQLQLYLIHLKE